MQKASFIDTSKITLVKNKFQPENTDMYDLKYDGKPFSLFSFGLVDSPPLKGSKYGEKYAFMFKPPCEDYSGLGALDTFDVSALVGSDVGSRNSFIGAGYLMNIKMSKGQKGFRFSNNVGLTVDNMDQHIEPGKPVTVVVSVGLWVKKPVDTDEASLDEALNSELGGSHGIYLTLTDLQFEKEEVPKKTAQRKTK